MMLRIYRLLLRLYPARYRSTFGREMAAVFRQAQADAWSRGAIRGAAFAFRELAGLALAALRERVRRPGVREQPAAAPWPAFDDVPTFYTSEDYSPRRSALVNGGILSLAFFSLVTAAFEYGVNHRTFHLGHGSPAAAPTQVIETRDSGFLAFGKSVVSSDDGALALVLGAQPRVAPIEVKPEGGRLEQAWSNLVWVLRMRPHLRLIAPAPVALRGEAVARPAISEAFTAVYFRVISVLGALDADHDYVISAAEIANAPAALRNLDRNHDGKLDAEECGQSYREFLSGANLAFMRFHPVLAALDADHDGEISAKEIENAAAALKTLDKNGDGKLTVDEILPAAGTEP